MEKSLLQVGIELKLLANQVATYIKGEFGKVQTHQIEEKDVNSLVSYVDQQAEIKLIEGLSKIIPSSSFITEEKMTRNERGNKWTWIIDPLDGTTNFLNGIPFFSISIALYKNNTAVIGLVEEVMHDEQFFALKGEGAFLNDRRIQVSNQSELNRSIIATGFPYRNEYDSEAHVQMINYWLLNSRGIRRFGSAALDLCYVAAGRFQVYYESMLNPWDLAAGALIVEEAGGVICNYRGEKFDANEGEIVATNSKLKSTVTAKIKDILRP